MALLGIFSQIFTENHLYLIHFYCYIKTNSFSRLFVTKYVSMHYLNVFVRLIQQYLYQKRTFAHSKKQLKMTKIVLKIDTFKLKTT